MPTTYSTSLRTSLIATGELAGTWGTVTNTNIGTLLEQAITGVVDIVMVDANYTLTALNAVSDESRNAVLRVTSSVSLTATRQIIIPNVDKVYVVINTTTGSQSIRVQTATPTSYVDIPNGYAAFVSCDGSAVVSQATASYNPATNAVIANLAGSTGLPLTTGVTGTLPVANGGTGVTTSTGSGNNVLSTSPALTTPALGTPSAAVLTNATGLPLTTGVTGTLPVANGGTGVTTSTGTGAVVLSASPTLTGTLNTGRILLVSSGSSAPPNSGTAVGAGLQQRFNDNSGAVLDVYGNGGTGYYLQVSDINALGTHYPLRLQVNGGTTSIGGALNYGGVTLSNSVTGTGSMVLSASPVLTGTVSTRSLRMVGSNVSGYSRASLDALLTLDNSSAAAFAWNYANGPGETDLFINRGAGGIGGLNLYDFPNTTGDPTLIAKFSGAGALVLTAGITATTGTFSSTLAVTGATTLSAALTYGGVTLSNSVTGTGSMVLSASPTLTTPALGVATATSLALGGATIGSNALAVTGAVDVSSHINSSGNITAGAALALSWFGRSVMTSPSDGVITIRNNANTDFARLQFGGTTSSFPAIKRNGTTLQARLADDSGYANLTAGVYYMVNNSAIADSADGVIRLSNSAGTDFSRLQFGGTTSSFPAIKRNATALNFRLADDSADAPITAAAVSLSGQLTSTRAMNTATGAGQIYLNGATGNRIDWNTNGIAPPAFTTRSAGTKLVLYPSLTSSTADFGFGIDSDTLWSSVASTAAQFKWYAGTTLAATLTGAGALSVGSSGNTLTITPNTTSGTAITLVGGGTGGMTLATSGGVQVAVTSTASAVNYVAITGGATGNGVTVSALGADTNVNLVLDAKGSGIISALDHINLASGKVLQVNSTQVVGPRDTGWTAMTGTADEVTSYATSTVTLAQLAGRVMALQTALTTHGLIGA